MLFPHVFMDNLLYCAYPSNLLHFYTLALLQVIRASLGELEPAVAQQAPNANRA